jgi:hypothetical protein
MDICIGGSARGDAGSKPTISIGSSQREPGPVVGKLEGADADPNVDDSEGSAREDTWLGRGSHGWFDRFLRQPGQQPS